MPLLLADQWEAVISAVGGATGAFVTAVCWFLTDGRFRGADGFLSFLSFCFLGGEGVVQC